MNNLDPKLRDLSHDLDSLSDFSDMAAAHQGGRTIANVQSIIADPSMDIYQKQSAIYHERVAGQETREAIKDASDAKTAQIRSMEEHIARLESEAQENPDKEVKVHHHHHHHKAAVPVVAVATPVITPVAVPVVQVADAAIAVKPKTKTPIADELATKLGVEKPSASEEPTASEKSKTSKDGPLIFKTPTVKESKENDIAARIRQGVLEIENEKKQKKEEKEQKEAQIVKEGLAKAKDLGVRY